MIDSQELFIEYGYTLLHKKGEELCGDHVEVTRDPDGTTTLTLADGLGSGVKANILSILTSKIVSTMVAAQMPLQDCMETIIDTLPVCKVRGVAYATFTVVQLHPNGRGFIIEFDNPRAVHLHEGKGLDFPRKAVEVCGRTVYFSEVQLAPGDLVVIMSDGAIYAGVGQLLNFGWQRPDIVKFLERQYNPAHSARAVAWSVADACNELYDGRPGDDTTVAALRCRPASPVNLMVGPPVHRQYDEVWVRRFLDMPGKRIVCGGTTSQMVARELKAPLTTSFDFPDKEIPPIGMIPGIDLTTEGTITLRRALDLSRAYLCETDLEPKYFSRQDGASRIADTLFEEATAVTFFVGQGVNKAHEGLPINITMKLKLIESLAANLRGMGKEVNILYA